MGLSMVIEVLLPRYISWIEESYFWNLEQLNAILISMSMLQIKLQ